MSNRLKDIVWRTASIQHWLKDEEAEWIAKISSWVKNGVILEIGTAFGRSATIMALASYKSHVYTIDNMSSKSLKDLSKGEYKKRVYDTWRRFGVNKRITLIVSDFRDVVIDNRLKRIDLLFIDGYQSFKDVNDAFIKFNPYIKKSGYLMIRDYLTKSTRDMLHEHGKFVNEVLLKNSSYRTYIKGQFVYARKIT